MAGGQCGGFERDGDTAAAQIAQPGQVEVSCHSQDERACGAVDRHVRRRCDGGRGSAGSRRDPEADLGAVLVAVEGGLFGQIYSFQDGRRVSTVQNRPLPVG